MHSSGSISSYFFQRINWLNLVQFKRVLMPCLATWGQRALNLKVHNIDFYFLTKNCVRPLGEGLGLFFPCLRHCCRRSANIVLSRRRRPRRGVVWCRSHVDRGRMDASWHRSLSVHLSLWSTQQARRAVCCSSLLRYRLNSTTFDQLYIRLTTSRTTSLKASCHVNLSRHFIRAASYV